MFKTLLIFCFFIGSTTGSVVFAESDRVPASLSSNPDRIKAEISRLRADVVGKDGKPNRRVIDDITKLENRLSELKFKEGRRSKR